MGYEITMYVGKKHDTMKSEMICIGEVSHFSHLDNEGVRTYYPDGNTETIVPNDCKFVTQSWFQEIAMLELCKIGSSGDNDFAPLVYKNIVEVFEDQDCYMYDRSGNTCVGEDRCGSFRRFVPLQEVIKALEKTVKQDKYRRFKVALALLKSIAKNFNEKDLGCIFYGH